MGSKGGIYGLLKEDKKRVETAIHPGTPKTL